MSEPSPEQQLIADLTLTVVEGEANEFEIEPRVIDIAVVPAIIEIMPISGLYNPPIYDADVAVGADISAYKIDQAELLAIVHADLDDDFAQVRADIDYLEAQVTAIQTAQGDYMTLSGAQTVAGAKTFQGTTVVPISSSWTSQQAVAMTVLNTRVPGQIRVGTTAPTAGLGADGDFYLQYTP